MRYSPKTAQKCRKCDILGHRADDAACGYSLGNALQLLLRDLFKALTWSVTRDGVDHNLTRGNLLDDSQPSLDLLFSGIVDMLAVALATQKHCLHDKLSLE